MQALFFVFALVFANSISATTAGVRIFIFLEQVEM